MMAPLSRLGKQIAEVTAALQRVGAPYALIGGLALASYRVIRATQDVDLLTDIEKADEIEAELVKLGYHCLHRTTNAGNYARGDERVDLLYAHRPIARRLLAGADELKTSLGDLRVISLEGLIGFKLQGLVNDPRRTQDLEDIRALLKANHAELDLSEVREYFQLFNRDSLLDELLQEIR
jgi:predicted nucleotidyltransferase